MYKYRGDVQNITRKINQAWAGFSPSSIIFVGLLFIGLYVGNSLRHVYWFNSRSV